jgi:hypothetical protein
VNQAALASDKAMQRRQCKEGSPMSSALTKDTAVLSMVSLSIGSFVCGMLFMLALKNYFQNDATYLYLFLLLLFPLYIFSSVVNARRIVKAIP